MKRSAWIMGAAGVIGALTLFWMIRSGSWDSAVTTGARHETTPRALGERSRGNGDARTAVEAFRARSKARSSADDRSAVGPESGESHLGAALIARLADDLSAQQLSNAEIQAWLASGRTNAADFLAARQAGGGEELLRLALERFPNDPQVLIAAAYMDSDPEAHRDRLDRLQRADPDNALAHYLSARNHLQNGRTEQAIADLISAREATKFEDHVVNSIANAEELYRHAGKTPVEASVLATSTALMNHLAGLKAMAVDLKALQQSYLDAGDRAASIELAAHSVRLAHHLSSNNRPALLIDDLVAIAVENIALSTFGPDEQLDFLWGTVEERRSELKERRMQFRADNATHEEWVRNANVEDLMLYIDILKARGEAAAMAWLRNREVAAP